jgi:hypothetical protein
MEKLLSGAQEVIFSCKITVNAYVVSRKTSAGFSCGCHIMLL